jgi:hypothetical protein
MATTNNGSNQNYANNSDGWQLAGGVTPRTLTVTGGNITMTGSGSNTFTFPAASDTLVGRASTDTLTNKTMTASSNVIGPSTLENSQWAWSSWTPTWTNLTIGNATVAATYTQIGKTVNFVVNVTFGSTSSMGTNPTFSLPVNAVTTGMIFPEVVWGNAGMSVSGVGTVFFGIVIYGSATTAEITTYNVAGTYPSLSGITSTAPFTWTNGSILVCTGSYQCV